MTGTKVVTMLSSTVWMLSLTLSKYVFAYSANVQYYDRNGSVVNDSFAEASYSKVHPYTVSIHLQDILGSSYRNWGNTFVSTISESDSMKLVLDTVVNLSNIHRSVEFLWLSFV